MSKNISVDDIKIALSGTGFSLEHTVTEAFRSAGWGVISNRYYVDDTEQKARELDLIAYRVSNVNEVEMVTTVLVSCKKDTQNVWAFLSRQKPSADANHDWQPVHSWTNVEPLNTYLGSTDWKTKYVSADKRIREFAFDIQRDVFAFQQIRPSSPTKTASVPPTKAATPQNDTAIFNAVSGLLKALDFEMNALKERAANRKRLYVFFLAVVVDAPLVDVQYTKKGIAEVRDLDHLLHLARYMVRQRHFNALVHFVSAEKLRWFVSELEHIAIASSKMFGGFVDESFKAFASNKAVQEYFAPLLAERLIRSLNSSLYVNKIKKSIAELEFSMRKDVLLVETDLDPEAAKFLDEDVDVRKTVAKTLKAIARYSGAFAIKPSFFFDDEF